MTTLCEPFNFETLKLRCGSHRVNDDGYMCLLEAVAYMAGEPWTDHPACVSPVLGSFGRTLNDLLPGEERQQLKPLIPALIGTANDGRDQKRKEIAVDWCLRTTTPAWLDATGHTQTASLLRALGPVTASGCAELLSSLRQIRDEIGVQQRASVNHLRETVREFRAANGIFNAMTVGALDAAMAAAIATDVADFAIASAINAVVGCTDPYGASYSSLGAACIDVDLETSIDTIAEIAADAAVGSDSPNWTATYILFRSQAAQHVAERYAATVASVRQSAIKLYQEMINP